jgi:CheY-like chemotaxis protein
MANVVIKDRRGRNPLKAGALREAILASEGVSSLATDERGVIQILSAGAERMLGYTEAEVAGKRTPADLADPLQAVERAKALSLEFATAIAPGFEALTFKASRGIEDQYELTWIRKGGGRLAAVVSVSALRDPNSEIIGYLLIATRDMARIASEPQQPAVERRDLAPQAPAASCEPPRRLLYVEGHAASFGLVEQLIARRTDVLLLRAANVGVGIDLARSARPDVILLNLDLPGTGAVQFMKLLRTDPVTQNTPLLALGADAAADAIAKALEAGFFHYLTKPLEPEPFMQALDHALEFAALERAEQDERAFTRAHSH